MFIKLLIHVTSHAYLSSIDFTIGLRVILNEQRERSHMTSARFWQILSPPPPCQQLSALSDPP